MNFVTFLPISGVILVNGWTDAPTAVTTYISTRSQKTGSAIITAAKINFFGVYIMSKFSGKVIDPITNIADFGNNSSNT